jgi:hypothetical protein
MKLPVMKGVIRRRILVNYRVDPVVLAGRLPARFRPKLQNGFGVAGICLIRLEHMRPAGFPEAMGMSSENAAHRAAVLWTDDEGVEQEGVYISRRDTGSALNAMAGGRLFPGEQHHARFDVDEDDRCIDLKVFSDDSKVRARVKGAWHGSLPPDSCFADLEEASAFFEGGSLGYSATRDLNRVDGVRLHTDGWSVEPLDVEEVFSSRFAKYPEGSIKFDCALAMRNVEHEWRATDDLQV